ncbi:integrin-linked protein kinase 1-like isoform X2 [Nymphaea colorata]|uniref:integrin-linked protein kinase 1-like isoform X2 n=1 Tax=Nymphaea colorata TaxID=210225 RepID=UPI00214F5F9E|nr:integrin-linked protein kinase 1-like isoform X2 [Nymphaea colorata]
MEEKASGRFSPEKQSSLVLEHIAEASTKPETWERIGPTFRLMFLVNEGDLQGIQELLDTGIDVNSTDIDDRTALHVAACQGRVEIVELLLEHGARLDMQDRWGSTPLADAHHYKHYDVCKIMEKYGAKPLMAPMLVHDIAEVPEYEIDPQELDFTGSEKITKGTFRLALWRGINVAVKTLDEDFMADKEKVMAFHDELSLLQKLRHPNVVQFLGAVTQTSPMMIVTEYLPKGDLWALLRRQGALKPSVAVKYALDIARGMNYLHERKPEAIIHRDLEPSNILRDDSGHLKVADFGLSKILKVTNSVKPEETLTCQETSCRYVAPEVLRNEEYDSKVDVFSFALILQEMIEGFAPFSAKREDEIAKAYACKERPPFRAPAKLYAHGLKELIEKCWAESPAERPTFRHIVASLDEINERLVSSTWKAKAFRCFRNLKVVWTIWHRKDQIGPSSRSSYFDHSIA